MHRVETHQECEHRVRSSFARQTLMDLFGASLTTIDAGAAEIRMPFRADLTQHHGCLHAAVVTALIDNACGFAAMTVSPADMEILTVECKVHFVDPTIGEVLVARGKVEKKGKTFTVCTGEALVCRDNQERRVATMLATMMALKA